VLKNVLSHFWIGEPISLGPKEGLALINGTQFNACPRSKGGGSTKQFFETRWHHWSDDDWGWWVLSAFFTRIAINWTAYRPVINICTNNLKTFWRISEIGPSSIKLARVQDPYSLRACTGSWSFPEMRGFSSTRSIEIRNHSVTDNPIRLFSEDHRPISGGNFHGQPMLALDYAV